MRLDVPANGWEVIETGQKEQGTRKRLCRYHILLNAPEVEKLRALLEVDVFQKHVRQGERDWEWDGGEDGFTACGLNEWAEEVRRSKQRIEQEQTHAPETVSYG